MSIKIYSHLTYLMVGGLLFWLFLFFLEVSKIYPENRIENISSLCEFVVHFFTIVVLCRIWPKIHGEARKILGLLVSSCVSLLLVDLFFEINVYLPKHYILSSKLLTVFSGYIPYLIFLITLAFFLIKILSECSFSRRTLVKLIPFFFVLNLIVIILFLSAIKYDFRYFSWQTMSHVVSLAIEFFIFDLALMSLIYSECRGFSIILVGIVILITGDFFINYSFLSQTSSLLSIGELLWFLGLMGVLFGLLLIQKNRDFILNCWCGKISKIKNQLALWVFGTAIVGFLVFFNISYFFSAINKQIFLGLPIFVMGYSIIVVLTSIVVGQYFSAPFKKLEKNVKKLILGNYDEVEHDFLQEEFVSLNKFIIDAHHIREENDRFKKNLGEIATQVAHDIRSPLIVLKTILNDLPSLPERKRIDARNAIQRVTDIANNLLSQYRENSEESAQGFSSEPVAIMLESIVSEKRIQVENSGIEIKLDFSEEMYSAFICVDIVGFKRVLSNLMNNAIEAFRDGSGVIIVKLRKNNGKVIIDVHDNGCGIFQEKLELLLKEGGTFGKKAGSGLGIPYAINKITEWDGDYVLTSQVGEGTQFKIILPEASAAEWFCGQIDLSPGNTVVILDDDEYVHRIWDSRFPEDFLLKNNLNLIHLNTPNELIEFVKENNIDDAVFFVDYELGLNYMSGLEVVRELDIGHRATLVTSRYEDEDIRRNCEVLGMRLIPKFFTEIIPISVCNPSKIVLIENEEVIRFYWQESAQGWGKSISAFHYPEDFMKVLHHYPQDTMIYIDSSLDNGVKGEEFAKGLYERGYTHLILTTGHPKFHFAHMSWIKDVVGKEPPWGSPPKKRNLRTM